MTMNTSPFPRLSDVSSRYIAWFSSVLVVTGLVAMFFVEIETKQDVPGEVVSDGEIKVTGMAGTVVEVFGHQDGSVQAGEPLFRLQRDFSLASNGEQRQRSSTRRMVYDVPRLIEYATSFYTLYPGDLIFSGTPEGVGPVKPGDEIRAGIERVGEFAIRVAPDYA